MRIATFNLENLDETSDEKAPNLETRVRILRPQLLRINADILCLQEVHGQERAGQKRDLLALKRLIQGTQYELYHMAATLTAQSQVYDVRNLVILSRFPIIETKQLRNDKMDDILYRRVTAIPKEDECREIGWERPILYCQIDTPNRPLHVINLHLKSRLPTSIPGQKQDFHYRTVSGWAEGYFLSSMKRVGQALETRILVDEIFDQQPDAQLVVCGDFNAEPGQVPVEAILGRVENVANPELAHRQMIAASDSVPKGLRFSHIHEGKGNLLDHIVFSRPMLEHYKGAEIHNELLHDESIAFALDSKFPESDHAPFVASFDDWF